MTGSAFDRLRRLSGFKACGENQFEARCPSHDDREASLSINIDHSGKILLYCHAGCKLERVLEAAGIQTRDLFKDSIGHFESERHRIIATYDYRNADGELSYQAVRFEPKNFSQRRPNGKNAWIWSIKGLKRLPYRLPELLRAEYAFIPEGEKDVDNLLRIGLTATCNNGGAGKWAAELNQYFRADQHITILPDNDEPGEKHSELIAANLHGKVASAKVLKLTGLPPKGDVSDWLVGRDPEAAAEELCRLADAAPEWKPTKHQEKPSIIHWAYEALEPQPAKEWIIQDLVGSRDVTVLVGDAGSKKTFSTLDLSVCVALGKQWLGHQTFRSQVLIVDEESGERRLKSRLGDCMRAQEAGPDLPIAFTTLAGITLATSEGTECLKQIIIETEARFVVMDALQDFTLGLDENSGQELAPVIHRLKTMAENLECAIWLLHHLNKQGSYRGHSSIKGLVDVMLRCESDPASNLIQFTAEKARDSLVTPFAATAHFDLGKFWLTDADTKTPIQNIGRPERYVIDYMMRQPDRVAKLIDITSHADRCTPGSARKAVYALVEKGRMARVDNDSGRGATATYRWVGGMTAEKGGIYEEFSAV
jgi:hypothetical protein